MQAEAPALTDEHLNLLSEKTEGWVAALWLVSLALERHAGGSEFVERFSGSNRAVADYLVGRGAKAIV